MNLSEQPDPAFGELSFSVVIPLFNKERYIKRAIESVLRQTEIPKEIIVVDDGSNDSGPDIVAKYAGEGIVLVRQPNKGVGPARNAGAAISSGAWVVFLDADDCWLPSHIAELIYLARQFPECGLLGTRYKELSTGFPPGTEVTQENQFVRRKVDYFKEASFNLGFICSSAVAVRADVFDDLGGFGSARPGQDTEFWARVALDYPVAASNRVTSVYYRGTGGVIEGLKNRTAPTSPVKSLSEVAPAIKMLCDRAEVDPFIMQSRSVRAYVNGRLLLGVRANALNGRLSRARSFSALMLKPLEKRFLLWKVFFLLPDSLIKITIWAHRQLKRFRVG